MTGGIELGRRCAGLVLAVLAVSSCGSAPTSKLGINEYAITATTRPTAYRTCATVSYMPVATMSLVDRELPNLGLGVLGQHDTYESLPEKMEVSVGVDVLDAYEDLDFESETKVIGGIDITISAAGAFGTDDRLLVLTWTQPGMADQCAERAVVGTNMNLADLLDAVDQIIGAE